MTPSTLDRVRSDRRLTLLATVAGTILALGAGAVHWIGLVAGGAVVGVAAPSLRVAVASGAAAGAIVWLAWLGTLAANGALAPAAATGLPFWLAGAIAVGAVAAGSVVRGIV